MIYRTKMTRRRKALLLVLVMGTVTAASILLFSLQDPDPAAVDAIPDPAIPDPAIPDPAIPDPAIPDPAITDLAIIDSVFIACEGDIGPAVNEAITDDSTPGNQRVLIGAGSCTSSEEWIGPPGTIIHGMGMGATQVTFTGGGSECAFAGAARDSSAIYLSSLTMIMEDSDRDILCIQGLSNTGALDRIETRGGRHHIVLTAATSDDSAAWVATISNWVSVDAGGNGLLVSNSEGAPHVRLQVIRPTVLRSGSSTIHVESMRNLSSAVSVIEADLRPGGDEAVRVEGSFNTPIIFLGGQAAIGAGQSFLTTDNSGLAIGIIDVDTGGDCDLLVDRPGTSDDIECSEDLLMVLPDGDEGANVATLSTNNQAIWRTWIEQIRMYAEQPTPFWAVENAEEIVCSGDIGPAVAAALAAGKNILLGKGECISSLDWEIRPGTIIIGKSNRSTPPERGTRVSFTESSPTTCAIHGSGRSVEILRLRIDSTAQRDLICLEGFTGRIEQISTRDGDGHIVLLPDENNVVAVGGVIGQLLTFRHVDGCNIRVDGDNSPTRLILVGMDIGRGGPSPILCFNGMKSDESSVVIVGNQFRMSHDGGEAPDRLMEFTNSGTTPVLWLASQPSSLTDTDIIVADSDIKVTLVGVSTRGNPAANNVCELLVDKQGTADNVPCSFYVQTVLDLVDP